MHLEEETLNCHLLFLTKYEKYLPTYVKKKKKKLKKMTSLRAYSEVKYLLPAPQGEWSRGFLKLQLQVLHPWIPMETSAKGLQIQTTPGTGTDILKEGLQSKSFSLISVEKRHVVFRFLEAQGLCCTRNNTFILRSCFCLSVIVAGIVSNHPTVKPPVTFMWKLKCFKWTIRCGACLLMLLLFSLNEPYFIRRRRRKKDCFIYL